MKHAADKKHKHKKSKPLPGFEHIKRYWDNKNHKITAKLHPGDFYVTTSGEMLVTLLGSCVSACIRDPKKNIGGMNHFLLPVHKGEHVLDGTNEGIMSRATQYGEWAMELLVDEILKHGGKRERLEVKLFGGARVLNLGTNIGEQNVNFVREFVSIENLNVLAEDLGGDEARKIIYHPCTGTVKVKRLSKTAVAVDNVKAEEVCHYQKVLQRSDEHVDNFGQDIDLF